MLTVKQLQEKRESLVTEERALLAPDAEFGDEQRSRVDAINDEIEKIDSDIDRAKRAETRANEPIGFTEPEDRGNITNVRDLEAERGFATLGEQLHAVRCAANPANGTVDKRLLHIHEEARAASGSNEAIPSDGGFLVQQDHSSQLMGTVIQSSELASRCTRIGVSGNGIKIPGVDETSRATGSRFGGLRGYWVDEADEITSSKPKFRMIDMTLNKLAALMYATEELLEDTTALTAWADLAVPAELRFLLEDAIMNGDGAGKPLGILNADCLVSQAKETSQAAATIKAENVIKMRSRMLASSRANAVWFNNVDTEPQLSTMSVAVGTGGSLVYMPANGLSQGGYDTLYGQPVIPIEQAQTLGTKGDLVYADMSQYLLIDKGGINSESSMHVRFVYDEMAFKWTMRVNGQPMRASALTPYKGTATVSPFVALATRS